MRIKKTRMMSTAIQFTESQYEISDAIMSSEGIKYFAEHVRNALDFYHCKKYPQFAAKKK